MKIRKVAEVVKEVLEQQPKARDNDNLLICFVVAKYGFNWNDSFANIMNEINKGNIPTLESITRARRKVAEIYSNLRGSDKVEDARLEKTSEYKSFSRDGRV